MNKKVCSVERADGLDNSFRKLLQNPEKILKPYIKNGMTILDFGCGPGFFTIGIAKLLGNNGKVIAADLQSGMLERIKQKIKGTNLENRIVLHKCEKDCIGINEKIDFILIFWMLHEVPNQIDTLKYLLDLLNNNGKILIVEPKIHVSEKEFNKMIKIINENKLNTENGPKIFFSRTLLLNK